MSDEFEFAEDDEFNQCPHEVARFTCGVGGCTCPCDPCTPCREGGGL